MTTAIQQASGKVDNATMLLLVAGGDCSRLAPDQKLAYYNARCEAAGLDPRAQPFEFVKLNGKEVLYARKAAADQLASKHGVKVEIVSQATDDGIRVVTVRAIAKDGRQTDEIGAVAVKGLQGDALCNAMMKAVTKAKRRAILSLCGLGMLDETEVESIPAAQPIAPVVEVLPPAGERPAPRAEAPKVIEATTAKPASSLPPAYVDSLWKKAKAAFGKQAGAKFSEAANAIFGDSPKKSNEWTVTECLDVEHVLFPPQDVPF